MLESNAMIKFACQECGMKFRANDDQMSRKTRCKQCGNAMIVPSPDTSPAPGRQVNQDPQPAASTDNQDQSQQQQVIQWNSRSIPPVRIQEPEVVDPFDNFKSDGDYDQGSSPYIH